MVGSREYGLDPAEKQVSSCAQQLQGPAALRTSKIKAREFEFAAFGTGKMARFGF